MNLTCILYPTPPQQSVFTPPRYPCPPSGIVRNRGAGLTQAGCVVLFSNVATPDPGPRPENGGMQAMSPRLPPARCARCGQLFTGRKCPNHTWQKDARSVWSRGRSRNPEWIGVRAWRLELSPLCQWGDGEGREECTSLADEVDHLDGTDYSDDSGMGRSWLALEMTRSLCTEHHRKRTSAQGNAAQHRG